MTTQYELAVYGRDDMIEKRVGLTVADKHRLLTALRRLQDEGKITDFTLDKHEPDLYTIGFDDTYQAVLDALRIE